MQQRRLGARELRGGMLDLVLGAISGGEKYRMLGGGMFEVLFGGWMFGVLLGCLKFGMMLRVMSSWMMFEMMFEVMLCTLLETRRIRLNLGMRERKD